MLVYLQQTWQKTLQPTDSYIYKSTETKTKSKKNHTIEIFNRHDQTRTSLDCGVEWDMIKVKKNTVIAARRNSYGDFHMKSFNDDEREQVHREASFHLNLDMKIPLSKFDVNGDCVIIENIQGYVEIWSIRDTVPKQIPFPNCDPFLRGNEKDYDCYWMVGEGEEILVAVFEDKRCLTPGCQSMGSCDDFYFALVFKNFELQTFVNRITFPKKPSRTDHVSMIKLTEIDLGNGHFKTVLVAECLRQDIYSDMKRYYYHIYDLRTGQLVETLSNDGCKSSISGSYLFPTDKYCVTAKPDSGVNISRINWNGSRCFISTHLIKFPFFYSSITVSISTVTDTRVKWNTSRGSIVVCDYLM